MTEKNIIMIKHKERNLIMMEITPAIDKKMLQNKAKDAWKALTETEMEMKMKLTITPLGLIAFAAGVGATVCAVRCLHKMEVKRALRKQAKTLKAESKAKIAEVKAEAKEEVKAAEAKATEIAE